VIGNRVALNSWEEWPDFPSCPGGPPQGMQKMLRIHTRHISLGKDIGDKG